MDLTSIMPYIFTLFIVFFVVTGFFIGLIRGLKRTVARFVLLAASVILLIVTITAITPKIMEMDVSFLNLTVNGQTTTTFKEYSALSLASSMNVPVEELGSSNDFLLALFAMSISCFVFAILFFLLKILTLIPYAIFNKILFRDRGKKKYRIAGGIVGLISGLLVALTFLSPVAGYASLRDDLYKIEISGQKFNGTEGVVADFFDSYKNDIGIQLLKTFGIEKYPLVLFNATSKAKFADKTFSLADERDYIFKSIPVAIKIFGDSSISDQIDNELFVESLSTLMESNIFCTAIVEFTPLIRESVKKTDFGDDEIAVEVKELMVEALTKLPEIEKSKIKECLTAVADLATEAMKAEDPDNCNYAKLGRGVDKLIELGIFSEEKINSLVVKAVEKTVGGVNEESVVYDVLQKVLEKVKVGVNSYETEFAAFGKVFEMKDLFEGEFSFAESGTELGAKIDETLAIHAEIIDKELINDMLRNAIDDYADELTDDFATYTDKIKNNLDNITSYEKEMSVLKIVFEMKDVVNDEFAFTASGTKLGAKIDELLAADSAIIDKQVVDDFLGSTIDKYVKDNLSGDFASYNETIKSNLTSVDSYEKEFDFVAKLIELSKADYSLENINDKGENGKTLGERLDEISSSVLVGSIPLNIIGKQLDNYADSSENAKYKDILDVVKKNYFDIRNNSTANGKADGYTYSDITAAFAELYDAMSTETSKVVGNTEFNAELATGYEAKLAKLADNIVLGEDGTRKVAIAVTDDILAFINEQYYAGLPQATAIKEKLATYKAYLGRNTNLCEEPYASENNIFADENGNTYNEDADGLTRVNKPFTFIAEKLGELFNF